MRKIFLQVKVLNILILTRNKKKKNPYVTKILIHKKKKGMRSRKYLSLNKLELLLFHKEKNDLLKL